MSSQNTFLENLNALVLASECTNGLSLNEKKEAWKNVFNLPDTITEWFSSMDFFDIKSSAEKVKEYIKGGLGIPDIISKCPRINQEFLKYVFSIDESPIQFDEEKIGTLKTILSVIEDFKGQNIKESINENLIEMFGISEELCNFLQSESKNIGSYLKFKSTAPEILTNFLKVVAESEIIKDELPESVILPEEVEVNFNYMYVGVPVNPPPFVTDVAYYPVMPHIEQSKPEEEQISIKYVGESFKFVKFSVTEEFSKFGLKINARFENHKQFKKIFDSESVNNMVFVHETGDTIQYLRHDSIENIELNRPENSFEWKQPLINGGFLPAEVETTVIKESDNEYAFFSGTDGKFYYLIKN